MMGVFAEFERAMIADRVRSGMARAQAAGKHCADGQRWTPPQNDGTVCGIHIPGRFEFGFRNGNRPWRTCLLN
jgi:Resolvase, N terminal domain